MAKIKNNRSNIFSILKPYRGMVTILILFTLVGNAANLVIPKIISHGIDSFSNNNYELKTILFEFFTAALVIFIFGMLQQIMQTYTSEKVAFNLREELSEKISRQSYTFIQKSNPDRLLTNFTSDMDSIKMFVSMAVSTIVSSSIVIIGASILLISINWKLGLSVLTMIPVISIVFYIVLKKVRVLFKRSREVIDWLNKVINESILGAAIIRVLNSQHFEYQKFMKASNEAKEIGIGILTLFATLIPVINFVSNLAILTILALGGHFVITDQLTLGEFAAFNSYVALLIFPIIMIGFMSNIIANASASYERIHQVMSARETADSGTLKKDLSGKLALNNVSIEYNGKPALKSVSIDIAAGTHTAIIGPTAAGKSQLLYILTGLLKPDAGEIIYDDQPLHLYQKDQFYNQVGFVFQDSIMFNLSLKENIAFNEQVSEEALQKAINTAELNDFVNTLPDRLDTLVSERGTSLSGGQKQRIMLARALALNPKILLLDDFTARVDRQTEQKILCNVMNNYPDLTLISVTQKITPVKHFEQIILLMEGEVVAKGKHKDLLETSPEYNQIYTSQLSTNHYEL